MLLPSARHSILAALLLVGTLGATVSARAVAARAVTVPESLAVTETWFFGSSTTDAGNLHAAVPIVPDPPYFQGRASNGPVWAESVAGALGTTARPSAFGGTNYAFGGARTGVVNLGFVPPITAQVADYLLEAGLVADPEALYVFQTAANDLTAAKQQPTEVAKEIMQDAVDATESMLIDLFDAGARRFLLLTVPELPTAPVSAELPNGANLAKLTNDGFEAVANHLEAMGATVWLFDLHGLVSRVVDHPDAFGLEVTRCSYLGKSALEVFSGDLLPEPCEPSVLVDDTMMFDDEHFTTTMHEIVAHEALAELCSGRWPTAASPLRPCVDVAERSASGELPVALRFELRAEGQLTVVPPLQPGSDPRCNANLGPEGEHPGAFVTLVDVGSGEGSHLGRFSFEATGCLDPLTGHAPGWGTMTAADGDQVFIEFFNSPAPAPQGLTGFAGPQTVVGGTGRFRGASGEQQCRGQADLSDRSVEFDCSGNLVIQPGAAGTW